MIKIDLITGFLGSGKTTFIKKYAKYLMDQGQKIGILENDYGAVNVDMMLLQDIQGEQCELEMVAGGCDADCHRRRFKTKLIAMGMSGYDRVLIEPSGIFDVDEFFDALYEEPLSRWYEIGNVFAIVDAKLEDNLSRQSEYMLASQTAHAGKVIISHSQDATEEDIEGVLTHLNRSMEMFQGSRKFIRAQLFAKNWDELEDEDYKKLLQASYRGADFVKEFGDDYDYNAVYIMQAKVTEEELKEAVKKLFADETCGNVFRVKGFLPVGGSCADDEKPAGGKEIANADKMNAGEKETVSADKMSAGGKEASSADASWIELNATRKGISVKPISKGQEIIIVIGENLVEEKIRQYLPSDELSF